MEIMLPFKTLFKVLEWGSKSVKSHACSDVVYDDVSLRIITDVEEAPERKLLLVESFNETSLIEASARIRCQYSHINFRCSISREEMEQFLRELNWDRNLHYFWNFDVPLVFKEGMMILFLHRKDSFKHSVKFHKCTLPSDISMHLETELFFRIRNDIPLVYKSNEEEFLAWKNFNWMKKDSCHHCKDGIDIYELATEYKPNTFLSENDYNERR